jgi:putative ABC transport system permease protein
MFLDSLRQDLRIGLRVLIKERGFCALAVGVFALGICGVTTQFSVVNGVVLRGFAFPNTERIMSIKFNDPAPTQPGFFGGVPNQILSMDYRELAENQRSFEKIAAYIFQSTVNVSYNNNAQRYTGAYVTEHFFGILGVQPVLGRDFNAADNVPGSEKVAIISHKIWQRDFAANPNVVGTAVRLNGKPATVVGVMPPGFGFPLGEELWIPYFNEFPIRPRHERNAPGAQASVLGLLRPDVSVAQAESEITSFASRLAKEFPETNKQFSVGYLEPLIRTFTPAFIRQLLFGMLALCILVLLLACANVMNMQFARATLRAKELAVRSSLGATRGRLIRQMLTESLLLASLGAIAGVALAFWATDFLHDTIRNQQTPIPSHITFEIDHVVLAFVVGITMFAAVISGVLPAWMGSRTNPIEALKESGRGNTSRAVSIVTRSLVVFTILLSCFILVGSLLFAQSIVRQQKIDYGYNTRGLMTARMALMEGSYPNPEARRQFYERTLRELRSSAEIESAALSNRTRMVFSTTGPARIELEGRDYKEDRDRPNVNVELVSQGFFATMGMKLLEGRDFTPDDVDDKLAVAIINAQFAKKQFGNDSPVGRRLRTVTGNGQVFGPWRTIVGVVSDVRMQGPFNNINAEEYGFYLPITSSPFGPARGQVAPQFATLIVKPRGVGADGGVASFANNLRRAMFRIDPDLPLYFVGTPAENLDSFLGTNRVIAMMFSVFGLVAMLLAAAGLYGVTSFAVNQRTSEFGIRMALGANQSRILGMVLGQGVVQLAVGLVLGLGLTATVAVLFKSGIQQQLFNTNPTDPLTYALVAVLLAVVSFVSTLIPARRATRVDPMIALRAE